MTARPKPVVRALLLGIGLWIIAGALALFAAASGPFGGFSFVDLAARVVSLAAAAFSLWAIYRAASALDFLVDAAEPTGSMAAVSPIPAELNAPESATTASN